MKKFNFNFSFLDRFKKSSPDSSEEVVEDSEVQEEEEIVDTNNSNRSEYDSDESPEDFAEKTLGGFNIKKYQKELQEAAAAAAENGPNEDHAINHRHEHSYGTSEFQEMSYNRPPEGKPKFKFSFKFPKFGRNKNPIKIKAAFAEKSPLNNLEKLNWNDIVLRLFSPYSRNKIHAVFVILLVVVVTYMFGKNIALFINRTPPVAKVQRPSIAIPLERVDTTVQDINRITSTNLFNVKESDKSGNDTNKKDIDSIVCLDASVATSAQIKLLDTIVLQDSVKSVASVQVRGSSELMNVREGERLEDMVEVSKINRMKLILKNLQTGDCEYAVTDSEEEPVMPDLKIYSAKAGKSLFKSNNPSIRNTGNNFKIKRAFRDSMINNMSEVLTQAKAIQITNPDGSLSFKMTDIVPGSLYSQLDIQENDIITNINGKKIENLNELMSLLGKIKDIDQFEIGLKRNGMSENKEYGFE